MMTGLPKTVRVGPHDITIGFYGKDDAEQEFGNFENAALKINVCREYSSGSQAVDTVIHELCHAMFYASGLRPIKHEEKICGMLGMMFTQLIRDNPELVTWMQNTVTK
jgi:hypothetical protein